MMNIDMMSKKTQKVVSERTLMLREWDARLREEYSQWHKTPGNNQSTFKEYLTLRVGMAHKEGQELVSQEVKILEADLIDARKRVLANDTRDASLYAVIRMKDEVIDYYADRAVKNEQALDAALNEMALLRAKLRRLEDKEPTNDQ